VDFKGFSIPGRFQKRIFIWIILTFIALILLFSIFSYINMEGIVVKKVYETNLDILSQVKYNVQLMDNTIKNLCKELFVNTDVAELMYGDDSDTFQNLLKMKNIELIIISNPFVESVYIYNGKTGEFFSPGKGITTDKQFFSGIAGEGKVIPSLKPIVLQNSIEKNISGKSMQTLAYFMYQYTDKNNVPSGALIINIDASWLLNNLEEINKRKNSVGKIYVFNVEGFFISDREKQSDPPDYIRKLFEDYRQGNLNIDDKKGYVEQKIEGASSIVTFLKIESAGLILIRMQSYEDAFGLFTAMRIALAVIIVIFLVIVFGTSVFISKAIYKPLGSFISKIGDNRNHSVEGVETTDEINYLEEVYKLSKNKLQKYEDNYIKSRNFLKEYHLKKLILNSSSFNPAGMGQWFSENNIGLGPDGLYSVCVLKIDGYIEFKNNNDSASRALIKFAIINIIAEIISSEYCAEGVDMEDERVVLLVNLENIQEAEGLFYSKMTGMIKQAQDCVLKYYNISFSASVSKCSSNIGDLTELYGNALDSSNYRLGVGRKSIIYPGNIAADRQHEYSFDCEKLLTESIKSGNFEKVEGVLQRILDETRKFDYKAIILSMLMVVEIIEKNVDDINSVSLEPVDVDFVLMKQTIFGIETLDEFFAILSQHLKMICDKRERNTVNAKHMVLAENVKSIIEKEYFDSALCLSAIAAKLKMSSGYLGKIFKDCCRLSVNEYINDVRLAKAVGWFKKSDLTVSEVLSKVGIENETYFYSLFKKRYGVTPKEYVLNNQIVNQVSKIE